MRGKWHHCSTPEDRAMRCGCLNSDIMAGSQSPIQHQQGQGQGTKAVGPGWGDITTQHKTPKEKMQWKQEFVCLLPRGGGVGLIVSVSVQGVTAEGQKTHVSYGNRNPTDPYWTILFSFRRRSSRHCSPIGHDGGPSVLLH